MFKNKLIVLALVSVIPVSINATSNTSEDKISQAIQKSLSEGYKVDVAAKSTFSRGYSTSKKKSARKKKSAKKRTRKGGIDKW